MRHARWFPVALVVLAGCADSDDTNRAVGELASDRIELTAESVEPISAILVAEGEPVAAGQALVEQDDRRARARLAEAEANVGQLQARLDELVRGPRAELVAAARANLEGATQELEFREQEMDRTREVHARGLASPEALDRAQAALDAAQANVKLRLAQLEELLTGTTVEELAQAEQAVKQAQARRDAASIDLERHTVRSPVAGIADSRLFELGERPNPGQPVMIVLAGTQPFARVFVPERLRVGVSSGTKVRVFVDGLDTALDGRVRWVASEAAFTPYFALTERDRGHLSYVAKIDLDVDGNRLPDGVPVEVEFPVD
ncbi:MAG: HlyD family efflux transporter periplasmic adaptor subunit [Gammaproteobacteria bacterium]|nr:HlyD family efflux transporter periplasmic adaptor subunit [Gammaproteobacteria bacterium]NNF50762.1 HlyD family efflux transporter periplasmic adaptor subunit [Woeseiaceae bacterium]MBT8094389.1 HlyD family efflux transporter periplasmic adaptor subunit [Gammaproteobacteria bacterium]MBT8104975.1 HlyD family efflux transporter periplasmic adaptor subunit [Gammaproteobacteria bacterium]NNK24989.1 HlyD family efflux transporter periplasmic adaptor subunit [Woeseiaceae bacterium]